MPRRPPRPPPPRLTKSQIEQELGWFIRLLESVSAKPDLTNGELRWRMKLLEDELRDLRRRIRTTPRRTPRS